jgi:hypothetical protein
MWHWNGEATSSWYQGWISNKQTGVPAERTEAGRGLLWGRGPQFTGCKLQSELLAELNLQKCVLRGQGQAEKQTQEGSRISGSEWQNSGSFSVGFQHNGNKCYQSLHPDLAGWC